MLIHIILFFYVFLFNIYISADPLECPSGTLAYGMTLFIPESVYWRDPDLGPPPIRLTIMCHNDELSSTIYRVKDFSSYLQKIAKSLLKFLLYPFS